MLKLIIGNRAYSSWSMRGWLAVKQSGEEFEELVVPMFDDEWEKRREGDEFAPSLGKVPILWDNDCVVWDSLAIIEFFADRVGRERYWPEDPAARGMARAIAGAKHGLVIVLNQHRFAVENHHELVDPLVPMALT
jgi:glutathione S-transferase